ncbi:MAG: hypothetical protein GXP28_06670 [Planctomycetes bacterium]|nr:hypothetical protein [Planctomycetota bacterium]
MKPDPPLSKLPSLSELLKHPTIERIVDQVNQTTIAQRATGFLEELRSNLPKSSGQGLVPSIHQLAERLARRLLESSAATSTSINATGAIWGDRWPSPPLAEAAIHEMMLVASEYHETSDALSKQVEALLKELTGAEAAWVGNNFETVAGLIEEYGNVEVAQHLGLIDPADFGLTHIETLADRLEAGSDLVLCDGAGLLGGPRCGILLGGKKRLEELIKQPSFASRAADPLALAALVATLDIYQAADQVVHKIPALRLLSTPLENLEQRCARLASLIVESDLVAEAHPTQCDSAWYDTSAVKYAGPTWALKLVPADNRAERLAQSLRASSPQILGREQADAIWLDMRAIFPRWDQQLISALDESL